MSDDIKIPRELAARWVASLGAPGSEERAWEDLEKCIRPQLKTVAERRAERLGLPWGEGGAVGSKRVEDVLSLTNHAAEMAEMLADVVENKRRVGYAEMQDLLTRAKWYSEDDNG